MREPATDPPRAPRVTVVMAVHNGARYLPEQIASARAQSVRDFVLLARDDGSRDGSWRILCEAAAADPRILPTRVPRARGAVATFEALLADVRTPFFALSDQDDVWAPDHLERGLAALEEAPEADLTHTDLELVDEAGRPLGERLWGRLRLRPAPGRRPRIYLVRNCVTGATVVGRTRLLARALPFPDGIPMHDWWLALVAAAGGGIVARREPTVSYRQHPGQLLGASPPGFRNVLRRLEARGVSWDEHLARHRRARLALHRAGGKRLPALRRWGWLAVFYEAPWPVRPLLVPFHALALAVASPGLGPRSILNETVLTAWPPGILRR